MEQISTIGIDLAKNVFQVHAVDAADKLVFSKAVKRAAFLPLLAKLPLCLVGMEACSGAAQSECFVAASLGAPIGQGRPQGQADPAGLCQGLCPPPEERCRRCRRDLRGGDAAFDAVCAGQGGGAAGVTGT